MTLTSKRKLLATLTALLSEIILANDIDSKTIRVAVDDFCPHVCIQGQQKGIFVDILEAILIPQGYHIDYKTLPFVRSLPELKLGNIDIVLALEKRNFDDITPLDTDFISDKICFYGRVGMDWKYQGIQSLQSKKIGIMDYTIDDKGLSLDNRILSSKLPLKISKFRPSSKQAVRRIFQMLYANRVDLFSYNYSIAEHYILINNIEGIRNYGCDEEKIYYTIGMFGNKPGAATILALIDKGIIKLIENGIYNKILNKYHYQIYN